MVPYFYFGIIFNMFTLHYGFEQNDLHCKFRYLKEKYEFRKRGPTLIKENSILKY